MENLETLDAFARAVDHMQAIFRITPTAVACDLHPGYLSTRWAHATAGERPVIAVQHHHAHIAAVMAEHGLDGSTPVIGFAFDGTGYGRDGAIWGGELLVADYHDFIRVAHLAYVPLPGGDAAVKRPYRIALAHLHAAGVPWAAGLPPVDAATEVERGVLMRQLETGFNTVPTSSMGRLFDAVAALAGVRQTVTYEGQAA
ncbi:MAG: carbamoyltransferase HypF, partial [Anaerolineae bacterium]|nr:carbamoyltransferase HypF [Anaerolineae bacterium]